MHANLNYHLYELENHWQFLNKTDKIKYLQVMSEKEKVKKTLSKNH